MARLLMIGFIIAVMLFYLDILLRFFGPNAYFDPDHRTGLSRLWNGPLSGPRRAVRVSAPIAAGLALYCLLSGYSIAETAACAIFVVYAAAVLPNDGINPLRLMDWHWPLLAAATFYAFSPWSIDQKLFVAVVLPFIFDVAIPLPFFFAACLFWLLRWFLGQFVRFWLETFPEAVFRCSRGAIILRPPRFRGAELSRTLCERCKKAVCASALLLGSWLMLVRNDERIPLHATVEEIQRSWRGC
jgi:hypothetical protein